MLGGDGHPPRWRPLRHAPGLAGPGPSPAPAASGPAILFVGNSLTAANDLPHRVRDLALDAGAPVDVDAVVFGGYSLEDHLNAGPALPRIRSRAWSYVVLQQGPSTLPESRVALIRDSTRMATEIRAVGARPALAVHCALNGSLPPAPPLALVRQRTQSALSDEQAAILREAACAPAAP